MSIPKKGSRTIVVAEEQFIWLIRRKATWQQCYDPLGCLYVAIEHSQEPGATLVIRTNRLHPNGRRSPSADMERFTIDPITSKDVAEWIEQALQIGWLPRQAGITFKAEVLDNYNCLRKWKK